MTIQARFLDLMPQKLVITPFRRMSTDGYGSPTYTTAPTTYRGRIVAAAEMEFKLQGQSVTPTHLAWLATTQAMDPRSRFQYAGTTYRILRVERPSDMVGLHHTKLYLKGG
jgi:hypothetical protein